MTKQTKGPQPAAKTKQVKLERTYSASLEDVWEMWTTKDGIESWWGPGGFAVTVSKLELQAGGELLYAMTAVAPPQIEFMKKAGMPVSTEARIRFVDVSPPHRLEYLHRVDFVPGVEPYDTATLVELEQTADGVRLTLTIDAMHDEEWTQRAVMGWESELGKLAQALAR